MGDWLVVVGGGGRGRGRGGGNGGIYVEVRIPFFLSFFCGRVLNVRLFFFCVFYDWHWRVLTFNSEILI